MTSLFSTPCYDVVIVGGGPSGSSAALALANAGVQVAVAEKASLPRYKTCGGGIVGRALQLIPMQIRKALEQHCNNAELHFPESSLHFRSTRPHPIVSMTMRENFDTLLLSEAVEAGAHLKSRTEVLDIVQDTNAVKLITREGDIYAKFIMAADGAAGTAARKAGWQETRVLVPALEYEVMVDANEFEKLKHSARFDFSPFGYAWAFPKSQHLSVGILTTRPRRANLKELMKRYIETLGIKSSTRIEKHGFVIPLSYRKDSFMKKRVVLVGDAAGFVDPLTGEGITWAIKSGQLAAKALLEGDFVTSRVREAYTRSLRESILPELKKASVLARLLYNYPGPRDFLFSRCGQELCEAVTDVMDGKTTYHQILSNPYNYIKLVRRML